MATHKSYATKPAPGWEAPLKMLLSNTIALPLSTPVVLPPMAIGGEINTPAGSVIVSTQAIAQDVAIAIAPGILKMSKDRTQKHDDGYGTVEDLAVKRQALKDYLLSKHGKADSYSKGEKKKIEKNEKILGQRNQQKRESK